MNSQQQGIRKAPFIYPEYLSQMTSKMKPRKTAAEEQGPPIFSSMKDGLLFPSQGLGDTTNIDELKQAQTSSSTTTATTAGETTTSSTSNNNMPAPRTQYSSGMTAASDPLPSQPLLYSSTNPMNRGMFMNQRMPNFNMSSAFSGGFSNLFSRKPIIPQEPSPPPPSQQDDGSKNYNNDDQSVTSTASTTRRLLFPETPIMLIPTPSKTSTPKRGGSSFTAATARSPKNYNATSTTTTTTTSPKLQPTISPLPPPPQSPFRNIGKALRMTSAGVVVGGNTGTTCDLPPRPEQPPTPTIATIHGGAPPPPSSNVSVASTASGISMASAAAANNNKPKVTIATTSNASVASTASGFSMTSTTSSSNHKQQPPTIRVAKLKEPPKIRVKRQNTRGLSPKRTCASCVCRDQKLVDQRKEIDHLKDVIQDLLVMSMETSRSHNRRSSTSDWDDDDSLESLESLPLPEVLEERAPHSGNLILASEMALNPTRQTFEVDPSDPLKREQVSSTSSMLQMSHSLQVKQAFKRGSPKNRSSRSDDDDSEDNLPKKIRHLRIQVNGNWGYYSGPKPSEDVQLIGCVVRFDNGDLYLGNMENSCFHGPGTYYPKGGKAFRGTFVWNQLDTADDEGDDYSC